MTHIIYEVPWKGVSVAILLTLCSILTLSLALAEEDNVIASIKGMPYRFARKVLIEQGYKPFPDPLRDSEWCVDGKDVCEAYPETINCSGTGFRPCVFRWLIGDGRVVEVGTSGERLRDLSVIGSRFDQYRVRQVKNLKGPLENLPQKTMAHVLYEITWLAYTATSHR